MANTPKERQQWIQDELKINPVLSFTECWGKFRGVWGRNENTFTTDWNKAIVIHKEYQKKLNEAKDTVSIESSLELIKNGLKSKSERLLILQTQINNSIEELESNIATDVYISNGEQFTTKRPLKIQEKAMLRKIIKELQSEISKIEGDYAPTKTEHSGEIKTKTVIKWGDNEISV